MRAVSTFKVQRVEEIILTVSTVPNLPFVCCGARTPLLGFGECNVGSRGKVRCPERLKDGRKVQ